MCSIPLIGQAIGGKAGGALTGLPFGLSGALLGAKLGAKKKPQQPAGIGVAAPATSGGY